MLGFTEAEQMTSDTLGARTVEHRNRVPFGGLLLTFLHAAHVAQLRSLVLALFGAAGALFQVVLRANGPGTHLIQNASGQDKNHSFPISI